MADHEGKEPMTEDEFTRFSRALMQVSKEELAEVAAAEEREKAEQGEKRRGRPKKNERLVTGD